MLVRLHKSLATISPDVAQYWNHSKNEKAPEQVLADSSSKAEWRCLSLQLASAHKTSRPQQVWLPDREVVVQSKGYQSQPTFAEAQPACLAEWDHEHNRARGIYLDNTTLGSGKLAALVPWICPCCPRGRPRSWTAPPYSHIAKGTGCAVCAGRQACVCNSLVSLFPSVAAEFDWDRNGFAPSEIAAGSSKKIWWRNAQHGSWMQTPNEHSGRHSELFVPSR